MPSGLGRHCALRAEHFELNACSFKFVKRVGEAQLQLVLGAGLLDGLHLRARCFRRLCADLYQLEAS